MADNSFEDLFNDPPKHEGLKDCVDTEVIDQQEEKTVAEAATPISLPEVKRSINDTPRTTVELVKLKNIEEDFDLLVNECRKTLEQLPFQNSDDFAKCRKNLEQNRIDFEESPSPFDLSRQLATVQVMKDDMLKVYADAHLTYTIRQRILDTLTDAYSVVSQAKTADKRKGEAAISLSKFSIASAEAEAFYDYCKKIVDNLESQYKMISRRIFCMEMQLNLGELQTSPPTGELDQSKKRLIRDILNERKKLDSEPRSVDWTE